MAISFEQIPASNRVPGPYVEIDGSKALGAQAPDPQRVLLVGFRSASGTALEGETKLIASETSGDALFGSTSQLAAIARAYKRVNRSAIVYAMALNEASGGVAATGTFTFAGTSTATGQVVARIGDQRAAVTIPSGTAAAAVGPLVNTAIGLLSRLPVSSSVASAVVTLTARHKGTHGNEVSIEIETLPAGITVTTVQPASGATNPDANTLVTAMDDVRYDTIVSGFNDAANLLILEAEMARRWGPLVKQPGMVFAAKSGSQGALTTFGDARNSQFSVVIGTGLSPTVPWIWAAQAAARDSQRNDSLNPNRPRNGLTLPDCEAPKSANAFDALQRDLLLHDGISTFKTDQSGRVMIERLITTYQVNASNISDATYLSIETQRNLAGIYVELLTLGSKYGDHLLATDGTNADPGVPLVTPSLYRGEIIAHNAGLEKRGRTYDAEGFAADLYVEINPLDKERLDVQVAHRLVGGLVTLAHKLSFQL